MSDFTAGRLKPCSGCPWRVEPLSPSVPDLDLHADFAETTFGDVDGFWPVMACHMNGPDHDGACVGYLLSDHAMVNLVVRYAITRGLLDLESLSSDAELHQTFAAWSLFGD